MHETFSKATGWLLVHEGGYVNDPQDPGGATNKGVTQKTYDGYRKRRGVLIQSVRLIKQAEILEIYKSQYWDAIRGDDLPRGLDYAVYDFAVNSGPKRAAELLQKLLGVEADGVIGNQTLGKVARLSGEDMRDLITSYCEARLTWMKTLSTFKRFGKGWTRRVMGEQLGVQEADTGVIDRAAKLYMGVATTAPTQPAAGKALEKDTRAVTKAAKGINETTLGSAAAGAVPTALVAAIQQEGPMQYALAAVVVVAALMAVVVFYKKVFST